MGTYDCFDVEALRGHDMTNILLAELLEDGGFAGVVEAEHQDSSFVVRALELAEERLRWVAAMVC